MTVADYRRVEKAIEYLGLHFKGQPSLGDVAAHVGLSEHHLQRLFKRWAGVSPKRFVQFLTASYAESLMAESSSLLEVSWEAGLSGPGRLHDLFVGVHGVTPGQWRSEGQGVTIRYGVHETPFGRCWLAMTDLGVCELQFLKDDEGFDIEGLRSRWSGAHLVEDGPATGATVDRIFAGGRGEGPLWMHLKGTNFQLKVWEALLRVPSGGVVSYADVAEAIGQPSASRAVGAAVGSNPVAVLVPCHRVLRRSGAISGYRWGAARKRALLGWEAAQRELREGGSTASAPSASRV